MGADELGPLLVPCLLGVDRDGCRSESGPTWTDVADGLAAATLIELLDVRATLE